MKGERTMTMPRLKGFPKHVERALYQVAKARAAWETVDETDKATKAEILNRYTFAEEDSGKRITEVNADFLMSESDFERYCELVYTRNCEKGIDSGGAGLTFWPIHEAAYAAEDALIDAIATDIPDYTPAIVKTIKDNPKRRAEFLAIIGL
jgi:hypothetical protein